MAIGYMIGVVLSNAKSTFYRDPLAKVEEDRPGKIFFSATHAMQALPGLNWRKCGDMPDEFDAYGPKGEIYFLVKIDTSNLLNPAQLRRPNTKLTREVI